MRPDALRQWEGRLDSFSKVQSLSDWREGPQAACITFPFTAYVDITGSRWRPHRAGEVVRENTNLAWAERLRAHIEER